MALRRLICLLSVTTAVLTAALQDDHQKAKRAPSSFDYVIVGGGTAGLTVASRLAENSSLSIAVIEAGTFSEISNGNNSQVPAYSVRGIGGGEYVNPWADWELETTNQSVCSCIAPLC